MAGLALVAETDYVFTVSAVLARRMADRSDLNVVAPPRSPGLEQYQVAQLWHPRNDRAPPHRWLRETVAASAKAATRN